MQAKQVLFGSAAREKILHGARQLADAVRITLGPRSKSVLIQKKWGVPTVCNDGVTIAREMELSDPEENLGAHMLRQAAERTGDAVGDGTSTALIINCMALCSFPTRSHLTRTTVCLASRDWLPRATALRTSPTSSTTAAASCRLGLSRSGSSRSGAR